jgi:hypothetical protein
MASTIKSQPNGLDIDKFISLLDHSELLEEGSEKLHEYLRTHEIRALRHFLALEGFLFNESIGELEWEEMYLKFIEAGADLQFACPNRSMQYNGLERHSRNHLNFKTKAFIDHCKANDFEYQPIVNGSPISSWCSYDTFNLDEFVFVCAGPFVDGWSSPDRPEVLYDALIAGGCKMLFPRSMLL